MYQCSVCTKSVGPRVALRKHTVYRWNKQIHREYPVCEECHKDLEAGMPLDVLLRQRGAPAAQVRLPPPPERPVLHQPVTLAGKRVTRGGLPQRG